MKKEDMQRMLAQVDEQYISEITESDADADMLYADEVSGEVEVVKHISHWRNWTAAAAAFIVCAGLGAVLIRPAIQHSQLEVGESVACYVDLVESLSDEELDNYFLNEMDNLPDFPLTEISDPLPKESTNPAIGKSMLDNMNIVFSEKHDFAEIHSISQGNYAVVARVWDDMPDLDFSQAEAYHIDEYDVDFYGAYFQAVSEPMPCSQSFFSYHGRMYNLYTDTLSKRDTIRLVYDILESDFSAKKLYLEYGMTEEDFVPYFTELDSQVSNLDYYHETALYEQYGDYYENSIDNITPPIGEKYFDKAEQLFLNNSTDKSVRFNMANSEHSIVMAIYDNPQIDMNTFTSLTPYHIDDYDIDFYGIYKNHDGNPIQNATMGIFQYQNKLYILNLTDFSRKETMQIVYEILDSDLSAESLYQQYCGDFVSMEDSRSLTLEEANELEFCKGLVPQLDTLQGENEKINGRNLGMDGEYVYDNLYDDSDLLLDTDTISYQQNEDGEMLSYSYSNPDCVLHVMYSSFLPDNANLAEHYSFKITLKNPFSYSIDGQDENSRLRNWDFWLDLGTCYVNLEGICSLNQEDAFINGLNTILVSQQQETWDKQADLQRVNASYDFCRNLVPQMMEVGEMSLERIMLAPEPGVSAAALTYAAFAPDGTVAKLFQVHYCDTVAIATEDVPVLNADQLTEEALQKEEIPANRFQIRHERGSITIMLGSCELNEVMPYLTELKNLLEKYDSANKDLELFNQNKFWCGLVPEIQNIGSLKFEGITEQEISNTALSETQEPTENSTTQYTIHYREPYTQGHELSIIYAEDITDGYYAGELGTFEEAQRVGNDSNNSRAFTLHAGLFNISIYAVGCTQEEIDLCLNEMNNLLEKNYHASDAILKYLNQKVIGQNWIPEFSSWNHFDFYHAFVIPTPDERSPIPEIQVYYHNKAGDAGFSCQYMKFPEDDSQEMLDIADMSDTWIVQNYSNQEIQNPDLWINCHDYYVHITAENCTSQAIDGYLFDLAQRYREMN